MNILKMTDSELYDLGVEALTTKLGKAGASRFLIINMHAPCTGDYSVERHEWQDNLPDIDTLVEQIQQASKEEKIERNRISKLKTYISKNGKPLATRIQEISDEDLYTLGLEALVGRLSIAGMPRFIRLCAPGTGPYAADNHKLPELDIVPITEEAKNEHPRNKK